jgi:hypothetical protein
MKCVQRLKMLGARLGGQQGVMDRMTYKYTEPIQRPGMVGLYSIVQDLFLTTLTCIPGVAIRCILKSLKSL